MEYTTLKHKVVQYAIISNLICFGIGFFFVTDKRAFAIGILFGGGIGILMFLQTAAALEKVIGLSPEKAQRYVTGRYFVRLAIYSVVLFVSLQAPYINFIGTIIGFFGVKLAILFMGMTGKIK